MIELAYIMGCISLIFFVAYPLLQPRMNNITSHDKLLAERSSSLLDSLRNLYKEYPEDSRKSDDFINIENRLILQLARLYKAAGIQPSGTAQAPVSDTTHGDQTKNPSCGNCGTKFASAYAFCPECGTSQA